MTVDEFEAEGIDLLPPLPDRIWLNDALTEDEQYWLDCLEEN